MESYADMYSAGLSQIFTCTMAALDFTSRTRILDPFAAAGAAPQIQVPEAR
jgi:hypothetical protein